jgi:glutamate synthase domain-containing protein 2
MDAPASEETPEQAAQYIASLTQELAQIARRNGLDTMARLEADQLIKR